MTLPRLSSESSLSDAGSFMKDNWLCDKKDI